MLGIGDTIPEFEIVGVKPKFMKHEENGQSAFETLTEGKLRREMESVLFLSEGFYLCLPDRDC